MALLATLFKAPAEGVTVADQFGHFLAQAGTGSVQTASAAGFNAMPVLSALGYFAGLMMLAGLVVLLAKHFTPYY